MLGVIAALNVVYLRQRDAKVGVPLARTALAQTAAAISRSLGWSPARAAVIRLSCHPCGQNLSDPHGALSRRLGRALGLRPTGCNEIGERRGVDHL